MTEQLLRRRKELPHPWIDPDSGGPNATAYRELTWCLVHRILAQLVFGDCRPGSVRAGRESVSFDVDDALWDDFQVELGLRDGNVRKWFCNGLACLLRRETPPPANVPLSPTLEGLLHLFEGFSHHGRSRRSGRRRHPQPGSLGFDSESSRDDGELAAVRRLLAWAGEDGWDTDDRYRVAYHVVWCPLSERAEIEQTAPADQRMELRLQLPDDFLARVRLPAAPPNSALPAASITPRHPATGFPSTMHSFERDDDRERRVLDILVEMLEPLLVLRGDPVTLIREAEASAQGLAIDLVRTWRRVILTNKLELYGEPGALLTLERSDPAWKLMDGPFPSYSHGNRIDVRIIRRGILLSHQVLVPGLVTLVRGPDKRGSR